MKLQLKRFKILLFIWVAVSFNYCYAQDSTSNKISRYIGFKTIYEQNTSFSVAANINNPIGYGIPFLLPVSKEETAYLETGLYFIRAATGAIYSHPKTIIIYSNYLTIPADFRLDMGVFYLSIGFSLQYLLSQYYDHLYGSVELYNPSIITPMINFCPGLQYNIYHNLGLFVEYRFDMDPKGFYAPSFGLINDSRFADGIGFGFKYKLDK
jgi:hypothetical protein